jgi:hypothetical protein
LQKVAPRSSLRCVEMLLVAIIVDPTAPVCSFDGRHLPTAERPLPLPQQFQCRASGFVQSPTGICKKIAAGALISGKSNPRHSGDYCCRSIASDYFTDDERCCGFG